MQARIFYFFAYRLTDISADISDINSVRDIYSFEVSFGKAFELLCVESVAVTVYGLQYAKMVFGFKFESYIFHLSGKAHAAAYC